MKKDFSATKWAKKCLLVTAVFCTLILSGCAEGSLTLVHFPKNSEEYSGQNYESVVSELQAVGFLSIDSIPIDDLTSESSIPDGSVESVLVNNQFVEKGAKLSCDTPICVTYHTIPKKAIPINSEDMQKIECDSLEEQLRSAGFFNISTNEVYDLDPDNSNALFINEVSINGKNSFSSGFYVPFDSEIVITSHLPFEKHTLILNIEFLGNLIFNKYDVNVFLDTDKIGTLKHGEDDEFVVRAKEGLHTIVFKSSTSSSAVGKVSLDVSCDVEASYQIICYSGEIYVEEIYIDYKQELAENETKIMSTSVAFKGENYKTVVSSLEKLGFVNIITVPEYDIIWGFTKAESVSSVSIAGKTDYRRGDIFNKDVDIVVTYHMPYEDDPKRESPTATSSATPLPDKYDIDKNLVLIRCDRDAKYTTQYVVVFAEYDSAGEIIRRYPFQSYRGCINPRAMGDEFNAIGALPSWFYVGATVHVKACLEGGGLSPSNCEVTQIISSSDSPPLPTNKSDTTPLVITGESCFNAILRGENVTYKDCAGDSQWYDRSSIVNNLSFEVVSEGTDGRIIFIQLYDINQTGNTDLFYKLISNLFEGEELATANIWLENNISKEATTTIGGMHLSLRLSVNNYPLLDIVNTDFPEYF